MARGRQRNFELEAKVLTLLADGHSAIDVAKKAGIHRNTVYLIQSRMEGASVATTLGLLTEKTNAIKAIKEEERQLQRKKDIAIKEFEKARCSVAASRLLESIATVRDLMLRSVRTDYTSPNRCVRPDRSLDKEFANGGSLLDMTPSDDQRPCDMAIDKERELLVADAMLALDDLQKRLMQLLYFDDISASEASERLGIAEDEVLNIHAASLAKLKPKLESVS